MHVGKFSIAFLSNLHSFIQYINCVHVKLAKSVLQYHFLYFGRTEIEFDLSLQPIESDPLICLRQNYIIFHICTMYVKEILIDPKACCFLKNRNLLISYIKL